MMHMITAIKNNITIRSMLIGAFCVSIAAFLFLLILDVYWLLIPGHSFDINYEVAKFLHILDPLLFFTVIPGTFAALFLSIIFRVFYAKLSMMRAMLVGATVGFLLDLCIASIVLILINFRMALEVFLIYFSLSTFFSVITAGWVARLIFKVIVRSRAIQASKTPPDN